MPIQSARHNRVYPKPLTLSLKYIYFQQPIEFYADLCCHEAMEKIKHVIVLSVMIAFATTGCTTTAFLLGGATAYVALKHHH